MTAYYNENDPRTAAWLRELIRAGAIAPGDVDERSIEDVLPSELAAYAQCHFFAGIGGWSYALRLAGWPDDRPVWTGSCPCQPFSAAGKGRGFADERHLWPAWHWLIERRQPSVIFGEQVAASSNWGWIDLVQADMEAQGYEVEYAVLGAHSVGKPFVRSRLFWVAAASQPDCLRWERFRAPPARESGELQFEGLVQRALQVAPPSGTYSLHDDGVPGSLGLLRGYGNAIVPQVAAAFIEAYDCA